MGKVAKGPMFDLSILTVCHTQLLVFYNRDACKERSGQKAAIRRDPAQDTGDSFRLVRFSDDFVMFIKSKKYLSGAKDWFVNHFLSTLSF